MCLLQIAAAEGALLDVVAEKASESTELRIISLALWAILRQ